MSHPETLYNMNHLYLRGEPTQPARKVRFTHVQTGSTLARSPANTLSSQPFRMPIYDLPIGTRACLAKRFGISLGWCATSGTACMFQQALTRAAILYIRANNPSSYPCYTIYFKQHGGDGILLTEALEGGLTGLI
ncbi:hypothetical protein GY45DRAFT_1315727, partial [Cubamyces sp. BRFM 1775]